jgi:outer membrane protein assembly factor BamA
VLSEEEDNELLNQDIKGFEKNILSGIELLFRRTTTDNPLFPLRGNLISLRSQMYDDTFGSDFNFYLLEADFRTYKAMNWQHTLAGQVFWKKVSGKIPFAEYADLGSQVRGLDDDKYVSNNMAFARIEDRFFPWILPFWKRFGGAIFLETGNSWQHSEEISLDTVKYSYGIGLRYILLPEEKINLRFDIAFSADTMEIEIISYEAF